MSATAMFPLGSVLFPHMPLGLRLFEKRYLMMLGQLLESDRPSFGVVLIERGQEVGGGEQRFVIGTMAEIVEVDAREDFVEVVAAGTVRFKVENWLPDDPFPQAELVTLAELEWDEDLRTKLTDTEATVRKALAVQSEFATSWPSDVELSSDPMAACWQLAALTPVGPIDQLKLLQVQATADLLALTADLAAEAIETLAMGTSDWDGLPPTDPID